MISNLDDYAADERQKLIASVNWRKTAQDLADRVLRLQTAQERAVYWLDLGSPGRAREELLEATKD